MTKFFLNKEGLDNIEVYSCGTLDWGENPRDEGMCHVAKLMGYELTGVTTPMTRVASNVMDAAAVSYFFNECGKNTDSWTKALYHYWYLPAPDGLDPSEVTGWTITATQTIPGSNVKNVYTCGSLQTDYTGF